MGKLRSVCHIQQSSASGSCVGVAALHVIMLCACTALPSCCSHASIVFWLLFWHVSFIRIWCSTPRRRSARWPNSHLPPPQHPVSSELAPIAALTTHLHYTLVRLRSPLSLLSVGARHLQQDKISHRCRAPGGRA